MKQDGERFAVGVSNCRTTHEVCAAVVRAEQLGAEIAFIAEDVNCRDAFALASVAATQTECIHVGTGVVNTYTRTPSSLAMGAATLDEISDGRAILGLGSSSPSLIRDQLGIPYGKPLKVMAEATAILRQLLAGDAASCSGDHFTLHEVRLAVRPVQSRLPIFFAAMGPRMLNLAGRFADGVLLNVGATPEYVRWAVTAVHDGAREAGRDPEKVTIAAWLSVYLDDDQDIALSRARAWLASMLSIPRQGELLLEHASVDAGILEPIRQRVSAYPHAGSPEEAGAYVPVEAAMRMAIIGSPSEARIRLNDYRLAGVDIPVMSIKTLEALHPD